MAGVHEWEDQGSALYENQIEACLGFAFLCRVGEGSLNDSRARRRFSPFVAFN